MASITASLAPRQYQECVVRDDGTVDSNDCYVPFWFTSTGIIVKWALFLGLITAIGLYLLIGYMHAQRRIKKGLPPLAYHRFLVSRAQRARLDPRYGFPQANVSPYYPNQYGMHAMPPPPVYDPNSARPPMYPGPPEGATKADPSQLNHQPQDEGYEAPLGPPPSNLAHQNTGSSNPFRS